MKCLNCGSDYEKQNYNQLFCRSRCRSVFRKKEEGEKLKLDRRKNIKDIECLPNEVWKDLLPNEYFISSLGRIYSSAYRKFFKIRTDKYGYSVVSLKKISKCPLTVHRLVAKTFIHNPENKPQINHINGIKSDNRIENLEWCTSQENITHSINTGLKRVAKGYKRLYKVEQIKRRKPIEEIDINGNILNKYKSQTEASEKTGIGISYLSRCCLGKQSYAYGRYFRFTKES